MEFTKAKITKSSEIPVCDISALLDGSNPLGSDYDCLIYMNDPNSEEKPTGGLMSRGTPDGGI